MKPIQQEFSQSSGTESGLRSLRSDLGLNADRPGSKVLVVEENSAHQPLLLQWLQQLGYVPEIANTQQEAISACSHNFYPILLVDWQLLAVNQPGSAPLVCALEGQVLKHQSHQAVIIAMIADSQQPDPRWLAAVRVTDQISKPIQKEVLAAMLKHWSQIHASLYPAPDNTQFPNNNIANFRQGFSDLQFDWDHLHQISDNNPEFELELLQLFVEDSYAHLAMLQSAIAEQNFQQIEQEAHHIKGASANVGATPMEAIASQLEQQARQHQLQSTTSFLSELEQFLRKLKAFVTSQQG
jgi:HPt (histidine-containing phosphotransfer) domain-containing protein